MKQAVPRPYIDFFDTNKIRVEYKTKDIGKRHRKYTCMDRLYLETSDACYISNAFTVFVALSKLLREIDYIIGLAGMFLLTHFQLFGNQS